MRANLFIILAFFAILVLPPAQAQDDMVMVGMEAPEFALLDAEGNMQDLSAYRGRVVVLEWTNHECPYTRWHYMKGTMQALQEQAKEKDIVWLSIVSSAPGKQGYVNPEQAQMLTKMREATPTGVLLDPDGILAQRYRAKTTPHMYVINEEGMIAYMGALDSNPYPSHTTREIKNYVEMALEDILNGQEVRMPVTRPYGCSIKFSNS